MSKSIFALVIYALFVFCGGLIGLIKAQSSASLIMGTVFACLLVAAAWGLWKGAEWGFYLAAGSSAFLLLFFAYRFYQSFKIMPAGMMIILSIIMLVILAWEKMSKNA